MSRALRRSTWYEHIDIAVQLSNHSLHSSHPFNKLILCGETYQPHVCTRISQDRFTHVVARSSRLCAFRFVRIRIVVSTSLRKSSTYAARWTFSATSSLFASASG